MRANVAAPGGLGSGGLGWDRRLSPGVLAQRGRGGAHPDRLMRSVVVVLLVELLELVLQCLQCLGPGPRAQPAQRGGVDSFVLALGLRMVRPPGDRLSPVPAGQVEHQGTGAAPTARVQRDMVVAQQQHRWLEPGDRALEGVPGGQGGLAGGCA